MSTVETDEEYDTVNNVIQGVVITIISVCSVSLLWAGITIILKG